MSAPLRLGIVGLGLAGTLMIDAAAKHSGIKLVAAADPNTVPAAAFAADFAARAYTDAEDLLADEEVEVVYIATPHELHAQQAIAAALRGKHVIIEKPLALTLSDCDAIVAATHASGVRSIVGHTHGYDPAVRMIREEIRGGAFGRLALVALSNYTDFLYRPRRPEELDTSRGGGIIFNQLPHQIDMARLIADSEVTRVRAATAVMDERRPTEGLVNAFLTFANGASASIIYSGYDFFDSDELHGWISELGTVKQAGQEGSARRRLAALRGDEASERSKTLTYGALRPEPPQHQPHFGVLTATCTGGDLRLGADGITICDASGRREVAVPAHLARSGHRRLLDEMIHAVRTQTDPMQNATWGRTTVAIALAMSQSAREDREISL
jgi:phthalate 4,5-cis-dihydrodiol dehydrogenase